MENHELQQFADDLCDELGLPKITVVSGIVTGYHPNHPTIMYNKSQMEQGNYDLRVVIAHEVWHHKQVIDEALTIGFHGDRLWYREFWSHFKIMITEHHKLPWEREAIEYENLIADRLGITQKRAI